MKDNVILINLIKENLLSAEVLLADKLGLFKKNDINVKIQIQEKFEFNSSKKEDYFNAMVGDLHMILPLNEQNREFIITSTLTRTTKLMTNKSFKKISDLDSKRVSSSLLDFFLLTDKKLLPKNLKFTKHYVNTHERIAALFDNEVDLITAIDPFNNYVIEQGGKVVFDSKWSNHHFLAWGFEKNFYLKNKNMVKRFHKVLNQSKQYFNNLDDVDKYQIMKNKLGYDNQHAKRLQNFKYEIDQNFSKQDFNICVKWMLEKQIITKQYQASQYIVKMFD